MVRPKRTQIIHLEDKQVGPAGPVGGAELSVLTAAARGAWLWKVSLIRRENIYYILI